MPATFEAQAQQTLENVKAVVEAAGLTLDHVVYTHVYLEDINNAAALDRVYARYFPKDPPARAMIGVSRLPGTPVEIDAVAVLNREGRTPVRTTGLGFALSQPFSPGILTRDRLFISSLPGRTANADACPEDPAPRWTPRSIASRPSRKPPACALAHVVFVNPYLTSSIPSSVMNERYAKRFEFGNTPARATISGVGLPRARHRVHRCGSA